MSFLCFRPRQRRPDKPVYVPRGRRSQTTPPAPIEPSPFSQPSTDPVQSPQTTTNHSVKLPPPVKFNATDENSHDAPITTSVTSVLKTPNIPQADVPNQSNNQTSSSDEQSSNECSPIENNNQQLLVSSEDEQVINNCDRRPANEHLIHNISNNTDSNRDSIGVTADIGHSNDKGSVRAVDDKDIPVVDTHETNEINETANEHLSEKHLIEYQKQSNMSSTKHVNNNKIKCNNETNHSDKDNNEDKEFQRASKVSMSTFLLSILLLFGFIGFSSRKFPLCRRSIVETGGS